MDSEINHSRMLVTTTDVWSQKIVRVAPNEGSYPLDATVRVTTDTPEGHVLTFNFYPEGSRHRIFLIAAEPPLETQPIGLRDYWVRGDRIVRDREFRLDSTEPFLARTCFNALRIESNIMDLNAPSDVRPEYPIDPDMYVLG